MGDTGYSGKGTKVHIIEGYYTGHYTGWALCGRDCFIIPTEEPVTCKTCLRIAAKEAAEKAKVE